MESNYFKDLIKMMGEMKNIGVDSENAFQKYKYASLSAILDTIRPILMKNNFALFQVVEEKDNKIYLKTSLIHESGKEQIMEIPLYWETLIASKNAWWDRGSSMTYARRYSISALLGISADEDTDVNELGEEKPVVYIDKTRLDELERILKECEADVKGELLKWAKIGSLEQITIEKFGMCRNILLQKAKKKEATNANT